MIGLKLLWTAVALFLIAPVLPVPALATVAAVVAIIGVVLMWLDK